MTLLRCAPVLVLWAAPAFAQLDLTGAWASVRNEDATERGPGPDRSELALHRQILQRLLPRRAIDRRPDVERGQRLHQVFLNQRDQFLMFEHRVDQR